MCCGNVQHIVVSGTVALQETLGDEFEHFQSLGSFEKASFVLGSELWENKYGTMLDLVKSYILDVWELRPC